MTSVIRVARSNTIRSTAEEDRSTQAALLHSLLNAYPAQLSVEEAVREMTLDPDDFAERDGVQRAIRDLSQAGLLCRQGRFVMPTRAAVRYSLIFDQWL